jgi:type IV secretory pathway TraG/TraD family ATPase VirD4
MGFLNWFKEEPKNKAPNTGAHGNFRWAHDADLQRIRAFEEIGLPVGYLNGKPFCHPAERKPHGLVLGNTGTGKTTRVFAPLALSDAASKMSIVAVDTAGDYSGIVLPYRSRLGPSWVLDPLNMLKGIPLRSTKPGCYSPTAHYLRSDPKRFSNRAGKLAGMCIPTNGNHERFFYKMSKRAIQGAIMGQARYAPNNCSLPAVADLFNGDFFEWVRWLLEDPGIDKSVRDLLHPFLTEQGKERELKSILDVINTIASEMEWIVNEEIADSLKNSSFSFASLADEVGTVTLCAPMNALDDGFGPWLSMILGCALTELQNTRGKIPVVFILDELAEYSSETVSKIVARIYKTGRKYNLRVYCVATSVGALERDCFQNGRHQDVLGNSGVIHVLNVSDPESSRFVKEMSGEKTAVSVSRSSSSQSSPQGSSSSRSTTATPHGVPVIRQEEVRGISDNSQVVLMDQCPYLIYAETKIFKEVPKLAARAGKNPFWKDSPAPKPQSRKQKRKNINEVAILLKDYGIK